MVETPHPILRRDPLPPSPRKKDRHLCTGKCTAPAEKGQAPAEKGQASLGRNRKRTGIFRKGSKAEKKPKNGRKKAEDRSGKGQAEKDRHLRSSPPGVACGGQGTTGRASKNACPFSVSVFPFDKRCLSFFRSCSLSFFRSPFPFPFFRSLSSPSRRGRDGEGEGTETSPWCLVSGQAC